MLRLHFLTGYERPDDAGFKEVEVDMRITEQMAVLTLEVAQALQVLKG